MKTHLVTDPAFRPYGRVVEGVDCVELQKVMDQTPTPSDVIYVPSEANLESLPIYKVFKDVLFGGMPIQLGYCNGSNQKLNALEYHRDSEFNYAATDLTVLVGKLQDVAPGAFTYDTSKVEAFFVPKGTLLECYATTLHYAPCGSAGQPFRWTVALPKGTNEPLERPMGKHGEDKLLTNVNKWLIAHKDSGLGANGEHIGLIGENITVE